MLFHRRSSRYLPVVYDRVHSLISIFGIVNRRIVNNAIQNRVLHFPVSCFLQSPVA